MAQNIFKDFKARNNQPREIKPRNLFAELNTNQAPKNIFKQLSSGQPLKPRQAVATTPPTNVIEQLKSIPREDVYDVASDVKLDAVVRPDIQALLSVATGGKSDELFRSKTGRAIIDVQTQMAIGFASGRTFGLPQLLTADFTPKFPGKDVAKAVLQPENAVNETVNMMTSLWGMSGAIKQMARLGPFRAISKLKPTSTAMVLGKRILDGGFKLGLYSVLSANGGKDLADNLKQRGQSAAHGFMLGSVFSAAHGITGELVKKSAGKLGLKVTDDYKHITAFAMRMGINQYVTGVESFKRYLAGEEHIPGLIYNIGLGTLFSFASNPLRLEADFNRAIKEQYKIAKMTPRDIAEKIGEFNSEKQIPMDLKWAYIMRATNGRVKPRYLNSGDYLKNQKLRISNPEQYELDVERGKVKTNIGATDSIFMGLLQREHPDIAKKFDFLRDFEVDIETAVLSAMKSPLTTEQSEVYHTKIEPQIVKEPEVKLSSEGVEVLGITEFFHGTTKINEGKILKEGFKSTQRDEDFSGLFISPSPETTDHFETTMKIRFKKKPKLFEFSEEFSIDDGNVQFELFNKAKAAGFKGKNIMQQYLESKGFDGINAPANDEVVLFHPNKFIETAKSKAKDAPTPATTQEAVAPKEFNGIPVEDLKEVVESDDIIIARGSKVKELVERDQSISEAVKFVSGTNLSDLDSIVIDTKTAKHFKPSDLEKSKSGQTILTEEAWRKYHTEYYGAYEDASFKLLDAINEFNAFNQKSGKFIPLIDIEFPDTTNAEGTIKGKVGDILYKTIHLTPEQLKGIKDKKHLEKLLFDNSITVSGNKIKSDALYLGEIEGNDYTTWAHDAVLDTKGLVVQYKLKKKTKLFKMELEEPMEEGGFDIVVIDQEFLEIDKQLRAGSVEVEGDILPLPASEALQNLYNTAKAFGAKGDTSKEVITNFLKEKKYDGLQMSFDTGRGKPFTDVILFEPQKSLELVAVTGQGGAPIPIKNATKGEPKLPTPEATPEVPQQTTREQSDQLHAEANNAVLEWQKIQTEILDLYKGKFAEQEGRTTEERFKDAFHRTPEVKGLRKAGEAKWREYKDKQAEARKLQERKDVTEEITLELEESTNREKPIQDTTHVTTEIKTGKKSVAKGEGLLKDRNLDIIIAETEPAFRRKGAGKRIIRNLITKATEQNKALATVTGDFSTPQGLVLIEKYGATFYDFKTDVSMTKEQALESVNRGETVSYVIDLRSPDFVASESGKDLPVIPYIPKELAEQENNHRAEIATGKDITTLKNTARYVRLLYKSKTGKEMTTQLNRFLGAYFNIPLKQIKNLTKEQIEEARVFMRQLVPNSKGGITLPRSKEIMPMSFFEQEVKPLGNIFDWLQSPRQSIRPIYDLLKPAYTQMVVSRKNKILELNNIYQGRVRKGSKEDKALAMYADNRIELDDVPIKVRDIAISRRKFYDEYADRLLEKNLIPRSVVFDKEGNRKRHYHRIFDGIITDYVMRDGFGLEELYLPGELPVAGPLKKRTGAQKNLKFSAIESDQRYVYGVEKYLGLAEANRAAIKIAKQYRGMKKSMANFYIRYIRGQQTGHDKNIQESWNNINQGLAKMLDGAGLKQMATKLRNSPAPSYPISRITSPLARIFYWRYVGLAVDTAMKNSIQWEHAMAKNGVDNVAKASRMQFTAEGKDLIAESGIHNEGIQRAGHFIAESGKTPTLTRFEEGSYWLWSKFDENNRNISGLSGYYAARDQGMSHQMAITEMQNTSHETQFGYTKADSLLVDMYTPLSRFILFKKWPLAKVEMIRSWIKQGRGDAVLNLGLQELMIYHAAQSVGVDLGNQFMAIWNFATRGISSPRDMVPIINEATQIYKMFGQGREAEIAQEQVINAWQGLGNRYMSKVINFFRAWQDDWNVRSHDGQLKYQSTAREQTTNLVTRSLESTKRRDVMQYMSKVKEEVEGYRDAIAKAVLDGDLDFAGRMQQEMMDKYAEDFQDFFGKTLQPVTRDNVISLKQRLETSSKERLRKTLPGKGPSVPAGVEPVFRKKGRPENLFTKLRGF